MAMSIVFAQKRITGTIIDAATHQALQGATILDLQHKISTISDQDGKFSLFETDSIQVTSVGYYPIKEAVNQQKTLISLSPSFGRNRKSAS
jgi:hypothetical protein